MSPDRTDANVCQVSSIRRLLTITRASNTMNALQALTHVIRHEPLAAINRTDTNAVVYQDSKETDSIVNVIIDFIMQTLTNWQHYFILFVQK